MRPTRRRFLHDAAFSAIAASFAPAAIAQGRFNGEGEAFSDENLAALEGVSMETFEPWIGSRFRVSLDRKPKGNLVLHAVEDMSAKAKDAPALPAADPLTGPAPKTGEAPAVSTFALHFRSTGTQLPQETYLLSHEWLGSFPLLLVPCRPNAPRPTCTAIFSLLKGTGGKKSE